MAPNNSFNQPHVYAQARPQRGPSAQARREAERAFYEQRARALQQRSGPTGNPTVSGAENAMQWHPMNSLEYVRRKIAAALGY